MKAALRFVFIAILFNFSFKIQAETSQSDLTPSCVHVVLQTCDKYYFLTKEIIRYFIILCCLIDAKRIDTVFIACSQCDYKLSGTYIWPWLIWSINKPLVSKMEWLMRYGSDDELAEFFLQSQKEEHIWCPSCLKDDGWYKIVYLK